MNKKKVLLAAAVTGLITTGMTQNASAYKCKGVAPIKANGCGANGHGCGGQATSDFDANEWVKVKDEATCKAAKEALKDPKVQDYVKALVKTTIKYN